MLYIRKLTYTLKFNHVHAPQFSPHLNFTAIISSHPSFQISSEHFLISIASKSTLHFWTGIDWTLPRHQHSFTSSTFLPLITSTSHSSIVSHCPSVNLLRLDICQPTRSCDDRPEEDFEFVVQSEMFLKIREISTSESPANGEVITC